MVHKVCALNELRFRFLLLVIGLGRREGGGGVGWYHIVDLW